MAEGVLILGESGTGKSTSLRNFAKDEVAIINVVGKRLPFKNDLFMRKESNPFKVADLLKATPPRFKAVVVDDFQYLMAFMLMEHASDKGYGKFTDIAVAAYDVIQAALSLPNDTIVYFLSHIETTSEGKDKIKTVGKMLDNQITIEGLFTIVLQTIVQEGRYYFTTQNNGNNTVKSPMGMFDELVIDNDLKAVDTAIRKYYGMAPLKAVKTQKQ